MSKHLIVFALSLLAACALGTTPSGSTGGPSQTDGGTPAGGGGGGAGTHTLTLESKGAGVISVTGTECRASRCTASVTAGTTVDVTARADSGATFAGFSGDCAGATCSLVMNADHSVSGSFNQAPPPPPGKARLIVHVEGTGAVTSSPAGIDCGVTCTASYDKGTLVTLSQAPGSGWHFVGWGTGCSGNGGCAVTMNGDTDVFAKFDRDPPPPPADECAGIMPENPLPPPVKVVIGHSNYGGCNFKTGSDGLGGVLAGNYESFDNGGDGYTVFEPDGTPRKFFSAGPFDQPVPFPLDSGWQWFTRGTHCSSVTGACNYFASISQIAHDGTVTSRKDLYLQTSGTQTDKLWSAANEPGKGMLVMHLHYVTATAWQVIAQRFDAASNALTPEVVVYENHDVGAPASIVGGISESGAMLVLFNNANGTHAVAGRWLNASGQPTTDVFQAKAVIADNAKMSLHRLLDDRLLLQADGSFVSAYAPGSTVEQPAPSWLDQKGTLEIIRAGKGYAVFFLGADGSDAALYARSGKRCGTVQLSKYSDPGDSGYDGTVILAGYNSYTDGCTRTFWPKLFAGH